MSLLPLLNFSGGELDPKLHDKATLDKFRNGLATARNVTITKIGSVQSRFSTYHAVEAKNDGEKIKLYYPPNTDYILEWGNLYVRVYSFDVYGTENTIDKYRLPYVQLNKELSHALTEADLPNMHFTTTGDYVYVFCSGKLTLKLQLADFSSAFVAAADIFKIPVAATSLIVTPTGPPSGYPIQYMATVIVNGEESSLVSQTGSGYQSPATATQFNTIKVKFTNNGQYPWVN